jgi:hypothetical protein
VFVTAR